MLRRVTLPDAKPDRLFFAQVREDPLLEMDALAAPEGLFRSGTEPVFRSGTEPGDGGTVVIVSSGGCTALSLLAAGVERVVGVDLNPAQNHLVELKAQAVAALEPGEAVGFL